MSFYRSLSPLEASYVATETPEHTPFTNQFIIEGDGTLDLEQWKAASEKVAKANTGIQLQLKGFWGWRYWDGDGPLPLVRKVNTDWDGQSSEHAPEIFSPFNAKSGPNAEIILIENSRAAPRILFRAHHGITDGMGMVHWIEECFRALRNDSLVGSNSKINEWDIAKTNEAPVRSVREGNCIPLSQTSKQPELRHCRWIHRNWAGKHTKVVPKLILAASIVAKSRHGKEGRTLFRVPSDLRRYLAKDSGFSMANASGAFDIETTDESTVRSIQSAILKGMRNKSDLSVFPSNMYLSNWLPKSMFNAKPESIRNMHTSGMYRMTGTISYIGQHNHEQLRYSKFTTRCLYGVPISLENRGLFIGVTNTSKALSISLSIPKALATHEELTELGEELRHAYNSL